MLATEFLDHVGSGAVEFQRGADGKLQATYHALEQAAYPVAWALVEQIERLVKINIEKLSPDDVETWRTTCVEVSISVEVSVSRLDSVPACAGMAHAVH